MDKDTLASVLLESFWLKHAASVIRLFYTIRYWTKNPVSQISRQLRRNVKSELSKCLSLQQTQVQGIVPKKKKHNQASTTGSAVPNITQGQCAFYASIQVGQQNFDLLLDTRAELTCVSPEIDWTLSTGNECASTDNYNPACVEVFVCI